MTSFEIRGKIDSLDSIKKAIKTLDGLHELIHMRMEYAQEHKMGNFDAPLRDWVVLNGLFLLKSNGLVAGAIVDNRQVTDPISATLPVMRLHTFKRRLPHISFAQTRPNLIPMEDCKCMICRKGWQPQDCRKVDARSSWDYIVFNRFAGLKLVNVLDEQERQTGRKFFTQWIIDENNKRVEPRLSSTVWAGMKGSFESVSFRHPECMKACYGRRL